MKAMIFAAGLGTRLRPFTLEHPKALVPVGGIPMLQRVITRLKSAGVDEFVVNVHHFANQIVDFLYQNHNFGCTIHISDESSLLLDTGGGILAARRWLDQGKEPFIVHNADILTDLSYETIIRANKSTDSVSTLLIGERDTTRYLLFDDSLNLRGWTNISTGEVRPASACASPIHKYAFGGIHVMHPSVFSSLADFRPSGTPFSIIDFYIESCDKIKITGYLPTLPYYWHDIGKLKTLEEAEQQLKIS